MSKTLAPKKLYKHQKKALSRVLNNPCYPLFMEQGTGKTPVAIKAIEKRFKEGLIHKVLVLVPSFIIFNWEEELANWLDLPKDKYVIETLSQSKKDKRMNAYKEFMLNDFSSLTLKQLNALGYTGKKKQEVLKQLPPQKLMIMVVNFEKARVMYKELLKYKPQFLTIDESQRVKERGSQVSKKTYFIARRCPYRLIMTGTPICNGYEDLYMQYKIVYDDDEILPTDWKHFEKRYIQKGGYMGHQTVGYKREEELRKILDTTSFRVTRNDCLDLPKSQDINLYCELSASARKMYDQMEEDMVVDIQHIAEEYPRKYLKDICNQMGIEYKRGERYISLLMKTQEYINSSTVDQVITQRIRLQQITGGFITNDVGKVIQIDNSKAQAVKDYLQDYKDPVVIFCKFLPEIQLLQDTFKGSKKKIAVLSGKTKKKDRGKMVKDFQNGKLDMIICQIRAGSVGINLTRSCLTILYSITHSYDDYVQAKSRTDRNGQTRKTLFAHVTCRNSIDEEVLDAVKVKQKRADKMLLKKPFTK